MTALISNVAISTDTFGSWITITNEMATAFRSNTMTVDSTAGGSVSTGNGYVNGYFGSNTLYATTALRGGTGSVSANLVISTNTTIQGNVNITGTSVNIGSSLFTINSSAISTTANVIFNGDLTVSGTLTAGISANASIIPASNNVYTLGNTARVFNTVYASNTVIYDIITIGGTTINATSYTGTATNALSANNSTYLNGQLASYYTNAGNLTGTLPYSSLGTNVINTTANFTISGMHTHTANVTLAGVIANSSIGSSGQILTSNGSSTYWSSPTSGVAGSNTQVQYNNSGVLAGAAGLTFNNVTNNVILANTLTVSSSVNAASFNATGQANAATLRATSSLDVASAVTGNATGVYTSGTVNAASYTVGSSFIANTTGVYTSGTVNAASYTVGTAVVANTTTLNSNGFVVNSTGAYVTGLVNAASYTVGSSFIANTSGVYHTGIVNTATFSVGALFTANSSLVNAYAVTVQTNTVTIGTAAYHAANGNFGVANSAPADKLSVNGTGYFNGNVTSLGVISSSSDERLKTEIKLIDNPLDKINAINGITFKFIDTDTVSTGLIAQEVEKVLPEAVSTNERGMKFVAYGNVVGLLVEAIKALKEEVEELKNGSIH